MTDNTQELDEILRDNLTHDEYQYTDKPHRMKQALLDWHNKQVNGIKICGKTVDEIAPILSGLEIERATEITVTMANLRKLYDKLKEEQQEMLSHAINSTLDRARAERNKLKEVK